MFITFECPQCKDRLEIDVQGVGAQVKCPHCQAAITVPRTGLGPGTTIGGFKIMRKLGVGKGEVYLARQLSMDRDVALKLLPAALSMNKEVSARFLNEVKVMAKLEHPHIVMAHEAGEDAGVLYLAMAYIEGESLEAYLERKGQFSERSSLTIVRKLAGALSYAWNRHQLLHRDIKPSNVLLDLEREPRLVDFGLAKSLGAGTGLTMTSKVIGTPNYMSPEQSQDAAHVDIRADMYSLGTLLYNMVTGEVPFAGKSLVEVLKKQMEESLLDPREYNAALSEGCVLLLEIMLANNREERHASWEALIADIERVAGGQNPTRELPPTSSSTLMRIRDMKQLAEVKGARKRMVKTRPWTGPDGKNKESIKTWIWAGAGLAAALLILLAIILPGGKDRTAPAGAQSGKTSGTGAVMTSEASAAKLSQAYLSALEYVSSHPEDFDGGIGRLQEVRRDGADTEYAQKAGEQIQRLETAKRQKVDAAWQALKQAAEQQAEQKQYAEGIAQLEQYTGPFAAELEPERKKLAEEWRANDKAQKDDQAKQRAAEEEKKQKLEAQAAETRRREACKSRLNAVMAEAARGLLHGDYEAAAKFMVSARGEEALLPVSNEVAVAAETVAKVADMNQLILESFNHEKGRDTEVEFRNGKVEKLRIMAVSGGKVKWQQQISGGSIGREFGVNELSPKEKIRRLGADASPAGSIMRGLMAYQGGNGTGAEACFKEAGSGLGTELARQIAERQALLAYRNLVRMMGAGTGGMETRQLAEWIRAKNWSPAQAKQMARGAQEFRTQYGESALARTNDAVLVALAGLGGTPATAAAQTPIREDTRETGLKQEPAPTTGPKMAKIPDTLIENAANAALMEILKLAGVGKDLTKSRDLMRQIAARAYPEADAVRIQEAVAAFENAHGETVTARSQWRLLDFLKQAGTEPRPPLLLATDENIQRVIEEWRIENHGNIGDAKSSIKDGATVIISVKNCPAQTVRALGDLPLSEFNGDSARIRDIAPLADCPLITLNLKRCPIEDFSVLTKIKTLQNLHLQNTQLKDLNVVQGLTNLCALNIRDTLVKDLSPLKGMTKLSNLTAGPMVKVNDLSLDCPLKQLSITGWPIKNLDFITNFPTLTDLSISSTPVKDLAPLRDLKLLNRLAMVDTPVRDLSPLEGMPLRDLNITGVPATNLNVLAGMPLKDLQLGHPELAMDLSSSLAGKDLSSLRLCGKVTSFAPFKEDVKLSFLQLSFDWIKVPDAAKLPEYIPSLESLQIPSPGQAEAEIVLRFPNLKKVSMPGITMTFDEFQDKFGRKEKAAQKSAR